MVKEIYLCDATQEELQSIMDNPLFDDANVYCEMPPHDPQSESEEEPSQQAEVMRPMENNPKIVKETPIHLTDGTNIHEIVSEISRVVGEDMDWSPEAKNEYANTYKRQTRNNDILARAISDKTARVVGDLMYDVAKSILDTSSMNNASLATHTTELYRSLFNHK